MSWVIIALGSAAVQGAVNILDKTVLHNFARSPLTLPLCIAVCQGCIGAVLALALPWPGELTPGPPGWALLSGVLWGTSVTFLFQAMHSQEVSRTTPIYQTFPIFAAIMALVFLDEQLSAIHWLAVAITVLGAVLLAVRPGEGYRRPFIHSSFLPLMLGSVIAGGAHVTGKLALDDGLPLLNAHALRSLGLAIPLLLWSLRRESVEEVAGLVRGRSPAVAIIGANEFLLASSGLLLALWALSLGPVTLVTTLIATRSFFVVFYSTALSFPFRGLLGEELTQGSIVLKFSCVVLIVGGIAAITAG